MRRPSTCAPCARLLAAGLIAVGVLGCEQYPDIEKRWDDDVVATGYDQDADFGSYATFAVDPTVHLVKDDDDGGVSVDSLPPKQADPIVEAVVENMEKRGYREVDADDDPDLGISITALNREVSGTVSGWWDYYGGYWGYWGWGYYYPYSYQYSYRTGSLVTEMIDLTVPLPDGGMFPFDGGLLPDRDGGVPDGGPSDAGGSPGNTRLIPVVWSSIAYRVLESNQARVSWATSSVDQAFEQSPYLEKD